MIVERLGARELDGTLERSAAFRWDGGETRVRVAVPLEDAGEPEDASPFLPLALLAAMRRGEELVVDAPASPLLLRGLARARELYRVWSPPLHPSAIRVAEEREIPRASTEIASFFSRGLDSTYSAAAADPYPGERSRLVFISGLDPFHDAEVRAEEVRRATRAAETIGLPLTVGSVTFLDAIAPVVGNADDFTAAALALPALALGGGLGTVVVPSLDSTVTLGPMGTSPVLDPLFSTEAVSLAHDSVALGRVEKGLWLARERPDLLAQLKVCPVENRADNCGHCAKCLLTMATLEAAGRLAEAEQFPDEIDIEAVAAMKVTSFQPRVEVAELARRLDPDRHGELRDALLHALGRAAPDFPPFTPRTDTPNFRGRHNALLVSVTRHGRPWPPLDGVEGPGGPGLVRALDPGGGRHVYGVGAAPPGAVAAELGSLLPGAGSGLEPLWLTAGGYLVTDAWSPPPPRATWLKALRWALAPLVWRDVDERAGARLRAALWRLAALARRRGRSSARLAVVGHLRREPTHTTLPLHTAVHPVTGDQLLTTHRWEANDMGYGPDTVLGHIENAAPVTGTLEPNGVRVPWASRFGRRVRNPDGTQATDQLTS